MAAEIRAETPKMRIKFSCPIIGGNAIFEVEVAPHENYTEVILALLKNIRRNLVGKPKIFCDLFEEKLGDIPMGLLRIYINKSDLLPILPTDPKKAEALFKDGETYTFVIDTDKALSPAEKEILRKTGNALNNLDNAVTNLDADKNAKSAARIYGFSKLGDLFVSFKKLADKRPELDSIYKFRKGLAAHLPMIVKGYEFEEPRDQIKKMHGKEAVVAASESLTELVIWECCYQGLPLPVFLKIGVVAPISKTVEEAKTSAVASPEPAPAASPQAVVGKALGQTFMPPPPPSTPDKDAAAALTNETSLAN